MEYRGYTIENMPVWGLSFYPTGGIDLGNVRTAKTVQDAKQQIDDIVFENTYYDVKTNTGVLQFTWLVEALGFLALNPTAELQFDFDSI